jgi:hypothetical protein
MQTGREPSRGSALAAPRTPAAVPARPARPTLTLKGKVSAPPQQVVPERPAVDTAAASSPRVEPVEVVPTPKPAPGAPAAADAPAKPVRPFRPWARSRVPSTAGPAVLARAQALNALLVAPIGVLPAALGDPIRPFQVGLGPKIFGCRRPEVAVNVCERAIRDYVRSFSYRHAVAQPGSLRYDLDGNPVEPVSEKDRHDMQRNCEVDQERTRQRKAAAALAAAAAGAEAGGPTEEAAPSGSQEG